MKGQELAINGRTEINVVMQEDAARMDEVVVVGYGTQKKVHLTGSIAAVSDDEIKKSTVSTISQALVGKLPGLITQQATGAPGSDGVTMLVRGYTARARWCWWTESSVRWVRSIRTTWRP